jgi:hypothetical protein
MRAFGSVVGGSFGNKMVPQWEPCEVTCDKRSKTATDPATISVVMSTPVATRHDRLGACPVEASVMQTASLLIGWLSQGPKPLPSVAFGPSASGTCRRMDGEIVKKAGQATRHTAISDSPGS